MLAAKHPPPPSTNSFWVPSSPPGHPRAYQPCAAESMSDASVTLPPFAHFGGTVQQQIRQAITWRQQKLQASSSSSSLQQASLAPLPAVPVPQLPSAAQPTTPHHPHHHQPPPPFINRPTSCRPPDLADSTRIVAVRGARAQPGDDGASPFSDSSHRQKCTCAASSQL